MRTTQLKIGDEKKDAVLVAGGPGFKIYTASGTDGWIIRIPRKTFVVVEGTAEFTTVGRYVNLRYQPIAEQQAIKLQFDSFLRSKTQRQPEALQPPAIQP